MYIQKQTHKHVDSLLKWEKKERNVENVLKAKSGENCRSLFNLIRAYKCMCVYKCNALIHLHMLVGDKAA